MINTECEELQRASRCGVACGNDDLAHLSNMTAIRNYVRIADEIAATLKAGKLLDWGCGYGQMSYLLRNRGIDVISFDVAPRGHIKDIPVFNALDIRYGDPLKPLPFENGSFDAVLSCGTLEHVPDMDTSLTDICRVLKENGRLFVYMLPNRFSYTEYLSDLRGISVHPVKFDASSIKTLLKQNGFSVVTIRKSGFIPRNLTGLPAGIKKIYGMFSHFLLAMDAFLSMIPVINTFCGVFEVIARKRNM